MTTTTRKRGAGRWATMTTAERKKLVEVLVNNTHQREGVLAAIAEQFPAEMLDGLPVILENVAQDPHRFGLHLDAGTRQRLMQWSGWILEANTTRHQGGGDGDE